MYPLIHGASDNTSGYERYVALDIHKEYVLAGGQNAKQEWVMPPRRVSMAKFREWASANLQEGDAVVLETTTNVWDIYDIVAAQATRIFSLAGLPPNGLR